MKTKLRNNGFSLTEVLMAVGILAVGMMLVATMFPVALYLTTVASERTMAAIVADEAFAKIQFYGFRNHPTSPNALYGRCRDYNDMCSYVGLSKIDPNEFSYPSVDPASNARQYYWSAMVMKLNTNSQDTEYLVTVFVLRKPNPNLKYPYGSGLYVDRPKPVSIVATLQTDANELIPESYSIDYFNPPTAIIHGSSGRLYRVIDRINDKVKLDRRWDKDTVSPNGNNLDPNSVIYVFPPPRAPGASKPSGKNPDIEVFQRIMRF